MEINKAVSEKIMKICDEKDISINKLASMSCLTQSTLQNIVGGCSKNPKLLTIVRICEGLGIKLSDFFTDDIFDDIDRAD